MGGKIRPIIIFNLVKNYSPKFAVDMAMSK